MNILLVEDNVSLGYITTHHLLDAGHAVKHAVSGEIALKIALSEPFDAILMNISMPDMSGVKVAGALRSPNSVNRDTFIVAFTGNASHAELETYASAGINACLAKPVKKKALIDTLTITINSSSKAISSERLTEYRRLLEGPLIAVATLNQFVAGRPLPRVLKTIEIFSVELKERIESLRSIVHREDAEGLKFLAHTLIGSAYLLGAGRLAELSRRTEQDLKMGHPFEPWIAAELLQVMVQTVEVFETVDSESSLQQILAKSDVKYSAVKVL